jgi:antitoxin CptB
MKSINKKTPDTEVLYRLLWQSRRGMLELDLMLEPFVTEVYFSLSDDQQSAYRDLLECEDQDIFSWLMSRSTPEESNIEAIVNLVIKHARNLD